MRTKEAVMAISDLARAYDTLLTPRAGVQTAQSYEVSSVLKAVNSLAEQIATGSTTPSPDDGIPF